MGAVDCRRSGCPDADACTSGLEGSEYLIRPPAPRATVLRLRRRLRLLRGPPIDATELRRSQRRSCCRKILAEYRPHRPHIHQCAICGTFLRSILRSVSTAGDPSPTAPTSTARGSTGQKCIVLRAFLSPLVIAVGAVGTSSPQPRSTPQSSAAEEASWFRSSSENMLEREVPNAPAKRSAATIDGLDVF
jgi:hypothetical protein